MKQFAVAYKKDKSFNHKELGAFLEEIPKMRWLKPDGKPKKEWKLFKTRDAAWDAAKAAAWDVAWAAARDAARAAAWDAAWAAARDAAWDAARDAQRARFLEIVGGE